MKRFQITLAVLLLVVAAAAVCLWGFRAWQDRQASNVPPILKKVTSVTVKSSKIPPPPLFPTDAR
jgi:hypothetical protein